MKKFKELKRIVKIKKQIEKLEKKQDKINNKNDYELTQKDYDFLLLSKRKIDYLISGKYGLTYFFYSLFDQKDFLDYDSIVSHFIDFNQIIVFYYE
jgi:hypothetical protein